MPPWAHSPLEWGALRRRLGRDDDAMSEVSFPDGSRKFLTHSVVKVGVMGVGDGYSAEASPGTLNVCICFQAMTERIGGNEQELDAESGCCVLIKSMCCGIKKKIKKPLWEKLKSVTPLGRGDAGRAPTRQKLSKRRSGSFSKRLRFVYSTTTALGKRRADGRRDSARNHVNAERHQEMTVFALRRKGASGVKEKSLRFGGTIEGDGITGRTPRPLL